MTRQRFQSACGDAPSDAFLAGAIQSAARSGRFSVERGTVHIIREDELTIEELQNVGAACEQNALENV